MSPFEIAKDIAVNGLEIEKDYDPEILESHVYLMHHILVSKYAGNALNYLEKKGVLHLILPEFDKVTKMNGKSFKSVWPHTMKVVDQSKQDRVIRWAALFHDFGKALTFEIIDGKVTFYRHEFVSASLFKRFANNWKIFSKDEFDEIYFLIRNLGYAESYVSNWSSSAVRRFIKDTGIYTDNLLTLSSADITTKYKSKREKILRRIESFRNRIADIKKRDSVIPLLPKGIGLDIMNIYNLESGKKVSYVKDELEKIIKEGDLKAYQDRNYYLKWMKKEGNRITF